MKHLSKAAQVAINLLLSVIVPTSIYIILIYAFNLPIIVKLILMIIVVIIAFRGGSKAADIIFDKK